MSDPRGPAGDAAAGLEAARAVDDGDLLLYVAYDREGFRTHYAAEPLVEFYGGREAMREQFERVHDYVNLDFMEREVFADVLSVGTPRAFVAYTDNSVLVRLLVGSDGVLLVLEQGADVTAVVEAVESAVVDD